MVDGRPNRLEQPPQANQGWTATRAWRILRRHSAVGNGWIQGAAADGDAISNVPCAAGGGRPV